MTGIRARLFKELIKWRGKNRATSNLTAIFSLNRQVSFLNHGGPADLRLNENPCDKTGDCTIGTLTNDPSPDAKMSNNQLSHQALHQRSHLSSIHSIVSSFCNCTLLSKSVIHLHHSSLTSFRLYRFHLFRHSCLNSLQACQVSFEFNSCESLFIELFL